MTIHSDRTGLAHRSRKLWRGLVVAWSNRPRAHGAIATVVVIALQLSGVMRPWEGVAWSARWWADPEVSRDTAPLVLAIDAPTVALLGPPPWSGQTWSWIDDALARQGLVDVLAADPWPLVMTSDAAATPTANVVRPSIAWDGVTPAANTPVPLLPAGLAGPPAAGGVFRQATHPDEPGAWLPCVMAGACRTADARTAVGIRRADVPIVSLSDLLDADGRFLSAPRGGAVLGLTAPPWAPQVALGPTGASTPWSVAMSAVLGSAAAYGASATPGPLAELGWLLFLAMAAMLALVSQPSRAWWVVAPAFGLAAVFVTEPLAGLRFPLLATVGVAIAPVASRETTALQARITTLRRVALLVLRAATRAGMVRRALRTPEAIRDGLADVVRNQLGDLPFAYVHRHKHSLGLRHVGGYGLDTAKLEMRALTLANPALSAIAATEQGGHVSGLSRDPSVRIRVVPLRQAGEVVGLWLLGIPADQAGPDARHLGRLAAWIGERLALADAPGPLAARRSLLPESLDDHTLSELFRAAETERARWNRALRAIGVPTLAADAAGVVSEINDAMADALARAGLPRVRSIRELLFRVAGDDAVRPLTVRLFSEIERVDLVWPAPDRKARLIIVPVAAEVGESDPSYGYVAWLEPDEDEAAERAREDHLRHWSHKVEHRLSTVLDAADAMGSGSEARRVHVVHFIRGQLAELTKDLQTVDAVVESARSHAPGPVDVVRLLRDELRRVSHLLEAADLAVSWRLPSEDQLAWAVVWHAQHGIRALFESLVTLAVSPDDIVVRVAHNADVVEVTLRFQSRADELLVAALAADAPDPEAVPAEIGALVRARRHLPTLTGTVHEGTVLLRLQFDLAVEA